MTVMGITTGGTLTLLDIVKAQGVDAEVGLVDETVKGIPEISGKTYYMGQEVTVPNVGAARTIKGIQYKTLVRTSLPAVGFITAGGASPQTKSTFENRLVETYTMNPNWGGPKTILDKSEDGAQTFMALEAVGHTASAMQTVGKCFYYGQNSTLGDAKGFPGLLDVYDSTNMVVDAGGTTESTCSSVWFVKFGARFVQWVYGASGQFQLSDVTLRPFYDASGYEGTKYHQELFCYPGLQVSTPLAVCRIKHLTAQKGCTLTDDIIGTALTKFKLAFSPDVIFMTKRSREQLRSSRIPITTGAKGVVVPTPTEWEGIPIAVTESLVDTETVAL